MDFLKDLMGGNGGLGGDIFQALLAGATGGFKGRPQWRDMEFMNDATNRLWPDEIKRQGDFLSGIAPSQAQAYNTYQDATYQQDTTRQTDRIKTMGSELGMSPWELTGSGGASPLPSPVMGGGAQGQDKTGTYLAALAPMQTAKLQAMTQLATTKMQTDAAKQMNAASNESSQVIASMQTANGKVPLTQADLNAANTVLTGAQTSNVHQQTKTGKAQEDLAWNQSGAIENDTILKAISTLAELAGKTEVTMGPYKRTVQNNYAALTLMYEELTRTGGGLTPDAVRNYIKRVPHDQWQGISNDLQKVSQMVIDAAGDIGKAAGEGIGGFLGGLFK